jgi:hypothetical protein
MIKITHIKWSNRSIGVALHKLAEGENTIKITAKGKDDKEYYPEPFTVEKSALESKYGVETINKNDLLGIWIPLKDIQEGTIGKSR